MSAWMKLDGISRQVAIAGLVRNAQTCQGIAGVRVEITGMPAKFQAKIDLLAQLYGADWERRKERPDRTQTRPDGYFYFLDLPDGDYTLSANWLQAGTRYGSAELQKTVSRDSEATCCPCYYCNRQQPAFHRCWTKIMLNATIPVT